MPLDFILQGFGLTGAVYALVFKIGYGLLANRYILTEEEVIEIYGVIQKNRRVTKLEHIRRVSVEIGVVGRILGFGDVLCYTSGSGGVDGRLRGISDPEALAQEADNLARRKQGNVVSDDLGSTTQGGSEILDAFNESQGENADIQRQILSTLVELRDEMRRNTQAIRNASGDRVSTSLLPKDKSEPN